MPRIRTHQPISAGLITLVLIGTSATAQQQEPKFDLLGDPLPEKALMRWGTQRFQHPDGVAKLVLTPNQKVIASIDEDHLVAWRIGTGKKLWEKKLKFRGSIHVGAAGYGLRPIAVSPDSGRLVTAGGLGRIAFWDPETGQSVEVPLEEPMATRSIDVSPDGRLLALGDRDRLAVSTLQGRFIYSKENDTSEEIPLNSRDRLMFSGHFSYGRFSPDGKLLALVTSENPRAIQLFEAGTGKEVRTIKTTDRVVRMEFSTDSKHIVATERDIAARLYNVASGNGVWTYQLEKAGQAESYTSDVVFRPDGLEIAVSAALGPDNTIRLVNAETGEERRVLSGSGWKPWTLQYGKDGEELYGSGWDGVIREWDVSTGEQAPRPGGVRASSVCAMSRRNDHMAFVDDAARVHLVDVGTGKTLREYREPGLEPEMIVFSDDGRLLAAGGPNKKQVQVVVWDLVANRKIHNWQWDKGRDPHSGIEALEFSRNGQRLAAAVFRQSAAYVWDLPTNKQIARVKHSEVYGMDLNANGTRLLTAGWDKRISIWDCDTGKKTKSLVVESDGGAGMDNDTRIYGVRLSNDETTIVTVDMTYSIRVYDRELNLQRVIPKAALFRYGTLDISNNDQWIAIGGGGVSRNESRGVRLYETATGEKVWGVAAHDNNLYTLDFGPRNRTILSGAEDGVCYLWDLQSENAMRGLPLDQVLDSMMDADGQLAFQAYQQLAQNPEAASRLLIDRLAAAAAKDISEQDVRRLLIPVGSGREALWFKSKTRLTEAGPAAWDHMKARVEAGDLSDKKLAIVQELMGTIERRYTRAALLLAELQAPGVNEALTKLRTTAASTKMKDLMKRAVDYHDSLNRE